LRGCAGLRVAGCGVCGGESPAHFCGLPRLPMPERYVTPTRTRGQPAVPRRPQRGVAPRAMSPNVRPFTLPPAIDQENQQPVVFSDPYSTNAERATEPMPHERMVTVRFANELDETPNSEELETAEAAWMRGDEPTEEGGVWYTFPACTEAIHSLVEHANRLRDLVGDLREKMGEHPPVSAAVYHTAEKTGAPITEATCVVCMDSAQKVAFAGCGHLCVCLECAHKLVKGSELEHEAKCPVCRRVSVPIALHQP